MNLRNIPLGWRRSEVFLAKVNILYYYMLTSPYAHCVSIYCPLSALNSHTQFKFTRRALHKGGDRNKICRSPAFQGSNVSDDLGSGELIQI